MLCLPVSCFNKRDYAAAQRLWSPDCIQHSAQRVERLQDERLVLFRGTCHDFIHPEAIEAALDRFQCALFRVVIHDAVGPAERKHLGVAVFGVDLVQHEPAHLGAQHVVVAVVLGGT
jgi:hypothetical protein